MTQKKHHPGYAIFSLCCIIGIVAMFYYHFTTDNTPQIADGIKTSLTDKIKDRSGIANAEITSNNVLYVYVVDDGINKDAMASYYCSMAYSNGAMVSATRIKDVTTKKILGTAYCK